jgi:2-methylcitrate dehydratase
LPYITVRTLLDGDIWIDSYTPEKLSEGRLLELMSRTRVEVDPKYDEIYPEAVPNRVSVKTSDGRTLTEEVVYPSGHFRNPMTDQQLSEKFFRLATPVLGRERAEELHRTAWRVSELKDLHQITSFFSF